MSTVHHANVPILTDHHATAETPHLTPQRLALILIGHWRLILLVTALCAVVAFVVGLFLLVTAPVYEASSAILVSRSRLLFRIESRIETSQDPVTNSAASVAALNTRLQTLATLGRSAEIESAVQQRLGEQLPVEFRHRGRLVEQVQVRPSSELLRVTARAHEPALAAMVANAWAEELADRVETVYSATGGTDSVETEVEKARVAYEAADRALSRFNIEHPVEDLARRVQAKSDEIKALQEQRIGYLRMRASALYTSLSTIDQLIRDAETLAAQLRQPTRSDAAAFGDALAVLIIRMRAYLPGHTLSPLSDSVAQRDERASVAQRDERAVTIVQSSGSASPVQLNLTAPQAVVGPSEDRPADLEAMIEALRGRRAEIQTEFELLARRLQGGLDASAYQSTDDDPLEAALSQATADLQKLRAELAELTRQRQELANLRNVYSTSYQALLNKAQELRVARATSGGEGAVVAARAVQPQQPAEPRPALFALVAAMLGLIVSCIVVLQQVLTQTHSNAPVRLNTEGGR